MSKQNNTLPIVLGIAVGVLLILNGFLLYSKFQQGKVLKTTETELEDTQKLQAELQVQYDDAIAQLDGLKTENQQLNQMIEAQKVELDDAKLRIENAIKSGKGSKNELASARKMIEDFKVQSQNYLKEIETLKAENVELAQANVSLGEEKTALEGIVEVQRTTTDSLKQEQTTLLGVKQKLEAKVKIASVLKAGFISVKTLKTKDNGGEKEVKKANRTDKVRVCLEVLQNAVAEPGDENFYLRLINPRGETLAKEVMGSGEFLDPTSNKSIRYTTSKSVSYERGAMDVCIDWDVESDQMESGIYQAEIYNKGYLSGAKEFTLK